MLRVPSHDLKSNLWLAHHSHRPAITLNLSAPQHDYLLWQPKQWHAPYVGPL